MFSILRPVWTCWSVLSLAAMVAMGAIVGCDFAQDKSAQGTKKTELALRDRPPLQVIVVGADIADDLRLQWESFSEQPIQIEVLSPADARVRSVDTTDVWIYPGNMLGDFVTQQKIIPLPNSASGTPYVDEELSSARTDSSAVQSWPARWGSQSRLGSTLYAMPLGAPQLLLIGRNLPLDLFDPLEEANPPIEDRTAFAEAKWNSLFAEASKHRSNQREKMLTLLEQLEADQQDALTDRFLWILSTTNGKRRGLFELTDMQPRFSTDDVRVATSAWIQLAELFPELSLSSHGDAWDLLLATPDSESALAIAHPEVQKLQNSTIAEGEAIAASKLLYHPASGLLASIGKKTRQTSVAAQFTAWLSTPEQRDSLSKLTCRVERWPNQPNSTLVQPDVRTYHQILNRAKGLDPMTLSLRFSKAHSYKNALATCLVKILQNPGSQAVAWMECTTAWNKLSEEGGRFEQRSSIELATGFAR